MHFLQEPIQGKVYYLVMVFITALVIVIAIEEFLGHIPFEHERAIENQWARRFLGKVVLEKATSVERDARALADADDPGDLPARMERIRASIRELERALDVLRTGGRYENSGAVDSPGADPLMQTISHRRDDEKDVRMERIDLAPGVMEIKALSEKIGKSVVEKLHRSGLHIPAASEAASESILARMDAVFQRTRVGAHKIVHDASLEIQRLEGKRAETVQTYTTLRYFLVIAASCVVLAIFLRAAGHHSRIIEDRRRALEEVRERNRETAFLLGAAKIGIAVFDKNHGVRRVDPLIEKAHGRAAARKCFEYLKKREEGCPDCPIEKAFRTRSIVVCETSLPMFENHPVQLTAIPFRTSEGEWLCAVVYVDMAACRQAEKAILSEKEKTEALNVSLEQSVKRTRRLAREAEAAHTAKNEFLARVDHEIRPPVNGVIRLLSRIKETAPTHEGQEGAALASASVESLQDIVDNILDFSMAEADKMDIEAWSSNLETAVNRLKGVLAARTDDVRERTDGSIVTPSPREEEDRSVDEVERERAASSVFVFDEAVARYDGDAKLLRGIIESFLIDTPRLIRKIEADIATGHPGRVGKHAHSLKGGASYIGAERLRDAAVDMEQAGKSDDASSTAALLPGLWSEFERFQTAVREHRWGKGEE